MFASRIVATPIILIATLLAGNAHAAKSQQEKDLAKRCDTGVATIQAAAKSRLEAYAAQIKAYTTAVEVGQKTPAQGVDLVVTEAADCLADILQSAIDETLLVNATAVSLLEELGNLRPAAFQVGTGSTLDKYHGSVTKQLEKARAKVEKALVGYAEKISDATAGNFEHRIVVPSLGQFVFADPNANDEPQLGEELPHPSRILVIVTAGAKNASNDGRLTIAGQTFCHPLDPLKPDISLNTVNAHPQIATTMDSRGVWQTSFSNLAPKNVTVWVEEDEAHSALMGDAGSLMIQVIAVP